MTEDIFVQNPAVEAILEDSEVKSLVNTTLNDAARAFDLDISTAQSVINAESSEEIQGIVGEALSGLQDLLSQPAQDQDEEGDIWWVGFLGSFTEGDKNQGMKRKSTRVGGDRR